VFPVRIHRPFALIASLLVLAGIAAGAAVDASAQQNYPDRPVRFVVPFPPAGASDLMARIPAQKLSEIWGKPVIIDNRTGGSSILGTRIVAGSPPDGYTLLLITFFHLTVPSLYTVPYDPVRDFSGAGAIAKSRYILIAHNSLSANSVKELIALAKSKPGELTYGSAGVGGGVHLVAALFNSMVGTKMLHVPYKGAGPMMQDLMGGRINIGFPTAAVGLPTVSSGKVKALAVSGETRFPSLAQVPTFAESGLPTFNVQGWFGIAVSSKTPRPIIDKISRDLAASIGSAEVQQQLAKAGMEPFIATPAQVDALVKADIARYAKVIKDENIKPED
jgi:tripartite-type tricarboxylate transporter receptor subunit TctC